MFAAQVHDFRSRLLSDPTATLLNRLDTGLSRVELAASVLRQQRQRADARFEALERGTEEALHALDALIDGPGRAEASAA